MAIEYTSVVASNGIFYAFRHPNIRDASWVMIFSPEQIITSRRRGYETAIEFMTPIAIRCGVANHLRHVRMNWLAPIPETIWQMNGIAKIITNVDGRKDVCSAFDQMIWAEDCSEVVMQDKHHIKDDRFSTFVAPIFKEHDEREQRSFALLADELFVGTPDYGSW